MDIQVTSASIDEKSILRNLFELYIYDYSEYMGWDLDQHGLFGYRYLDHYWTEPNRYPFLVRADDNLAGFALVTVVDDRTHMSEFFILRKYRRQGVGEAVARNLFARFPGPWHVDELAQNEAAQRFWRTVIDRATGGDYLEHTSPDSRKVIQEFAIRPGDDS
jgi:predicted acetyltransferase